LELSSKTADHLFPILILAPMVVVLLLPATEEMVETEEMGELGEL